MKLSSGAIPIRKLLDAGVKVGLGVDGSASNDASNMLWDLRMAYLLHKHELQGRGLTTNETLSLATRGSARVLGWENDIGSLEVGKAADLFMLDSRKLGFAGALFDDAALPLTVGATQADMTIVGGRVVVEDGRLVGIDEEQLAFRTQLAADRLVNSASLRLGIDYRKYRG
jgi:cytosine/adenosine deaminase-related metal-dependent hydrolase